MDYYFPKTASMFDPELFFSNRKSPKEPDTRSSSAFRSSKKGRIYCAAWKRSVAVHHLSFASSILVIDD